MAVLWISFGMLGLNVSMLGNLLTNMDTPTVQVAHDMPLSAGFIYCCTSWNVCCWQSQVSFCVPAQRLPVTCNTSAV